MAAMEKTRTPGIHKRGNRYVVVWRHRGKQHKESFRTYEEAREAKAQRQAGDRRPVSKIRFEDFFESWIESYSGRTARGFSETSREEYRRMVESHALPLWGTWKLSEVEPADVRSMLAAMREAGKSTSEIKKARSTFSALFGTAVEDGLLRSNPAQGVRIPVGGEEAEESAKAMTREELGVLLAALPGEWTLFFELLTHSGLRISEMVGLTWQNLYLGDEARIEVREQVYRGKRRKLKSRDARRDIPLSRAMTEKLLEHRRDSFRGPDAPVFDRPRV